MAEPVSVLFVCLGNICRSTMAEGVFRSAAQQPRYSGLVGTVDSCGTGAYHVGDPPDDRTMSMLEENGIADYDHSARRFQTKDLSKFDYVFAMDRSNLSDLQRAQRNTVGDGRAKVMLFGEYGGGANAEVISDPYYGGQDGFHKAFEQCSRFSKNFLEELLGGRGEAGQEA